MWYKCLSEKPALWRPVVGISFDIRAANWIAYLCEPKGDVPSLGDSWAERETLSFFLYQLRNSFMSSDYRENELRSLAESAVQMLDGMSERLNSSDVSSILGDLRRFLSVSGYGRKWTALLVPSYRRRDIDYVLCSQEFLRFLVRIRPEDPGLILQLNEPPQEVFTLTDVFPAFKTALNESVHWPGILLWTRSGDSVFLPFGSASERQLRERAEWVISHLATTVGVDLDLLRRQYLAAFPETRSGSRTQINLIHLSDIHIGSQEASRRLPRVQQLLRNLIAEIGESALIVPLVSGDLMDDPREEHLDRVRSFLDFLANLGTDEPITLIGNHDVRKDGYLGDNFKIAMGLPGNPARVVWYEPAHIALACFNSVIDGRLARGFIGERQLAYIGNELDRKKDWKDYTLISVLHHHPIPVEVPPWYVRPFYERILGDWFEKTEALEDASAFMRFHARRGVSAILHGHKHIPRIDKCPETGIPVYGCGSTVGKVSTDDRSTFMSINVISVDTSTSSLTARLLAERIPGEGLTEQKRHEAIHGSSVIPAERRG
jgi:3',5'-cyclic AMP phosphodiesterase CpdA